jgi:hypothetical protein
MKCPYRKEILKQNYPTSEITTEVFADCYEKECQAYTEYGQCLVTLNPKK